MELLTNKKFLIIVIVSIVLILIGIVLFIFYRENFESFKLVSTSPDTKESIPTSTSSIVLKFNKEIDGNKISIKNVSSNSTIVRNLSSSDKTITLSLSPLVVDKEYSIKIDQVTAKNGEEIKDIKLDFFAKYVPYNKLTEEERQQGIQDTDPEISTSSIRNFLPLVTPNYTLIGGKIYFSNGKSQDIVQVKDIFYKGINPPYPESEIKYSAESIKNFLKETGVDRNSYLLTSTNPTMAKYIGANPIPSDAKISPDNYTGDGSPPVN